MFENGDVHMYQFQVRQGKKKHRENKPVLFGSVEQYVEGNEAKLIRVRVGNTCQAAERRL